MSTLSMFHLPLAQTPAPAADPEAIAAPQSESSTPQPAVSKPSAQFPRWEVGGGYHISQGWLRFPRDNSYTITGVTSLFTTLIAGFILARIFAKKIQHYQLTRALRWGVITLAIYFGLIGIKPWQMTDSEDLIAVIIHKSFVAIMLIVGLRLLDRLVIVPLLTRGGKVTLSRFIHQIILAIFSIFVTAGYLHWAFNIDISSFLAGSAVISIVVGLALQETLGNFFSGMVIQASVPFQPGDWIQIGDVEGRVVEMTWRAVTLLTRAGNNVLIPNGTVAKERIVNYHTPEKATAYFVTVGLDYAIPPNDAKRVLTHAARETPGVLATPEPGAALASFDDSAILYKLSFWTDEPEKHGVVEQLVRTNIWYRLKQAGYAVPFPVRTVEMIDSEKKQSREMQQASERRLAAITRNPLFERVPQPQREKLARETRDVTLSAGQTFYHQNDPGDSLFIVLDGVVDVFVKTPDNREFDVGDITADSFFGEISAMTGHPRPDTIRAQTDVTAIEITHHHLQELFAADPALMQHISEITARRHTEQEAELQKLGAPANPQSAHTQHSVLDRMKRLFTRLHR